MTDIRERFVVINYIWVDGAPRWKVGVAESRPGAIRLLESRMDGKERPSLGGRDRIRRFLEGDQDDGTVNVYGERGQVAAIMWVDE